MFECVSHVHAYCLYRKKDAVKNFVMKRFGFLFFTQLTVSSTALFFVVRRLGGLATLDASFFVPPAFWVVICFAAALLAHGLGVWRWQILANAVLSSPRPFSFYLRYYLIGLFYGTFVPGGQLVGEGVKIARMMPDTAARSALISSIMADRLIGLAANGILMVFLFLGSFSIRESPFSEFIFFTGGAIILGICTVLVLLAAPFFRGRFFLSVAQESMRHLLGKMNALMISFIGAFLFHIAAGLLLYLIVRAYGARVDFFFVIWIYLVASIALLLPVSYAGFGIREGVLVSLLVFSGVFAGTALLVSLFFFVVQAVFALTGGIYEIRELRNRL